MAIKKDGHIEANKATPITYWKYAGFDRLVKNVIRPEAAADDEGQPIPQKGVVILLDGYTSQDIRNSDGVKSDGLEPDKTHEFILFNWIERTQNTRPATLEEKKTQKQFKDKTDDELNAIDVDILLGENETPHNDFDIYMKAINTPDEAKITYGLLKAGPCSRHFFSDATDIL